MPFVSKLLKEKIKLKLMSIQNIELIKFLSLDIEEKRFPIKTNGAPKMPDPIGWNGTIFFLFLI